MIYNLWNTKETTMSHIKGLEDEKFELRQDLAAHCMECFSPDKMDDPAQGVEFGTLYSIVAELILVEKEIEEYHNV
jgi:hypothetical protein